MGVNVAREGLGEAGGGNAGMDGVFLRYHVDGFKGRSFRAGGDTHVCMCGAGVG